jgi:hypothetical protein
MSELTNCPICGGLREDGVCQESHPATREQRIDALFKSWVASEIGRNNLDE